MEPRQNLLVFRPTGAELGHGLGLARFGDVAGLGGKLVLELVEIVARGRRAQLGPQELEKRGLVDTLDALLHALTGEDAAVVVLPDIRGLTGKQAGHHARDDSDRGQGHDQRGHGEHEFALEGHPVTSSSCEIM